METSHSVGKNLVANTLTTMFTVPSRTRVHWNMLYAVNHTASAKNFSAWWYDASEGVSVAVVESYPKTDSALQNIVDEIVGQYLETLYLLTLK